MISFLANDMIVRFASKLMKSLRTELIVRVHPPSLHQRKDELVAESFLPAKNAEAVSTGDLRAALEDHQATGDRLVRQTK